MKNFADRLINKIVEKESVSVVGLDPRLDRFPRYIIQDAKECFGETFEAVGYAIFEFNRNIIDSVCGHVGIVKPQVAFYERFGAAGMNAFQKTVNYAKKKGLLVIEDAKRSDIGSTARAYATGHLGEVGQFTYKKKSLDVDAITVDIYLGSDGIKPFIDVCQEFNKGIFALVKTSNPSSNEIQDLVLRDGRKVCESAADLVNSLGKNLIGNNGYSSVGAVVGATYPQESKILREIMKKSFFLVPGYGVQGGSAETVMNCFNKDGLGALISSSRAIDYAYQDYRFSCKQAEYEKASEKAVIEMNKEITKVLKKNGKLPW